MVGSKNPQWTGGKLNYYGENWIQQNQRARQRDHFTCQRCGITESQLGKNLDVHHVKPFKLCANHKEANRLENLISLCPPCHRRAENKFRRDNGITINQFEIPMPDDYVSPKAAAVILGIDERVIYRMIYRNQLPYNNLVEGIEGRRRRRYAIPRSALK